MSRLRFTVLERGIDPKDLPNYTPIQESELALIRKIISEQTVNDKPMTYDEFMNEIKKELEKM